MNRCPDIWIERRIFRLVDELVGERAGIIERSGEVCRLHFFYLLTAACSNGRRGFFKVNLVLIGNSYAQKCVFAF